MWIFTKYGFFSAVQHKASSDKILIRAQFRGDLERLFSSLDLYGIYSGLKAKPEIEETPHGDYRFRTTVSRSAFADIMSELAYDVDYIHAKPELAKSGVDDPDGGGIRTQSNLSVFNTMVQAGIDMQQ